MKIRQTGVKQLTNISVILVAKWNYLPLIICILAMSITIKAVAAQESRRIMRWDAQPAPLRDPAESMPRLPPATIPTALLYRPTKIQEVHENPLAGERIYMEGYAAIQPGESEYDLPKAILIFETRIVEEPYLVLDMTLLDRTARSDAGKRCRGVCRIRFLGQVDGRIGSSTAITAHAIAVDAEPGAK